MIIITIIVNIINMILLFQRTTAICTTYYIFQADVRVATIQQHLQKTTILHIADPSSVQDMCHMNFKIDLAHHGVSMVQRLKHWNMESKGLRCDSSWGLRIFSLSTLVTRPKKISFSIINIIVI